MTLQVQLRAAKIPFVGWLAVHYWYVIGEGDRQQRWEVWQQRDLIPGSWGHLYQNLLPPEAGVGNGGSWLSQQWSGERAQRLAQVLETSPHTYPHTQLYRYVPGPNSNTYAQWVLQQAQMDHRLEWRGIGRGYGQGWQRLFTGKD